jgi:hypothetical protein
MYLETIDIEKMDDFIMEHDADTFVFMVLLADEEQFSVSEITDLFNIRKRKLAGAIFPALIHNGVLKKSGLILWALPAQTIPVIFDLLGSYKKTLTEVYKEFNFEVNKSAFILAEGFSPHISTFVADLYSYFGTGISYLGVGAIGADFIQKPTVFDNKGIYQDAVLVVFHEVTFRQQLIKNWEPAFGPFLVTDKHKHTIESINWESPAKIYRQFIGKKKFRESFFDIAVKNPLGIYKYGGQFVIRSVVAETERETLICGGEIPDNSLVYIMKEKSFEKLKKNEAPSVCHWMFVSESYLRKDNFQWIMDKFSLSSEGSEMNGAVSYVEIASCVPGFVEINNQSIITAAHDT